ncbi:hypothetical protein WMY93_026560 [Mugilogobius chulae]|uniref:Reverse transcriptase RNase H-like domain-containing protein n=1 Tax=Mugilogobius chulae TaxID=88201 RepID=A0AAW0N198_9GOBI
MEFDMTVLGVSLPHLGVLIVEDPVDCYMKQKKARVPGVLGMNVLNPLYSELCKKYGPDLWESPELESAPRGWRRALRYCQMMEAIANSPDPHPIRVQDFQKPFVLEVDASHGGLGAVLSQDHEGKLRPVAFASRSLKPTERNMNNYSSMKLELVALKWAVTEKFREYLLGNKCTVFTDNNPLSHLATAKLGATEQRWVSELAMFDLTLKYRPGSQNANADALSRQHAFVGETKARSIAEEVSGVQEEIGALPGCRVLTSVRSSIKILSLAHFWSTGRRVEGLMSQRETTGRTPYFLMFGREPQLPVDFLIGKEIAEEDLPLEEWVEEHQRSLASAYETVQQRIDSKMAQRDLRNQDLCVAPDFEEGDLVYTRNHSVKGRNKIQDFWDPTPFQIVRPPPARGVVYSVAPAGQVGPLRQVHRAELRSVPESRVVEEASEIDILDAPSERCIQNNDSHDMSEYEALSGADGGVASGLDNDVVSSQGFPGQELIMETGTSGSEPRRSVRKTAGQHSNPYRLPQSVQTKL